MTIYKSKKRHSSTHYLMKSGKVRMTTSSCIPSVQRLSELPTLSMQLLPSFQDTDKSSKKLWTANSSPNLTLNPPTKTISSVYTILRSMTPSAAVGPHWPPHLLLHLLSSEVPIHYSASPSTSLSSSHALDRYDFSPEIPQKEDQQR